jgi:transposase
MAKATTARLKATIGCDLGDKKMEICILWTDDRIERPKPVGMTREEVRMFFATQKPCHVVIEVGTHSRWVQEIVSKLGHKVTVANPRRLKLISQSYSKSDSSDAELLARMGRADEQMLSPIQHRSEEAQADLAMAKARDELVRTRTRLVNSCRSMVKSFGYRLPSCTAESFHKRARAAVPKILQPALEPIFETLVQLQVAISTLEKQFLQLTKKYPDVERIAQIDGVGYLTALVFLLTLEDKSRYQSRSVGAYLGLCPRKDQSGEQDKQLGITKAGDPFVRVLLVNCANYILGPFGKDSDLKRWGLKLSERGGKNARKRAKVAVARKLAVVMHRLWVTAEDYQPIGYRARAKAKAA